MTRAQLAKAQFLLNTYERAYVNGANPAGGKYGSPASIDRAVFEIADRAREAFWELTGRLIWECHIWEFNTDDPAAWTKER
jgi:hypothetical protein